MQLPSPKWEGDRKEMSGGNGRRTYVMLRAANLVSMSYGSMQIIKVRTMLKLIEKPY